MKTIIMLCSAILILSFGRFDRSSLACQRVAQQTCTINDESSQDLGIDTIYYSGGSTVIDMPGTGTYSPTIGSDASSICIASQTVFYPNTGVVTLGSGEKVQIAWTGTNAITITDYSTIH